MPPHIQDRVERKHARARARAGRPVWYRRAWFLAAVAAVVALIGGIAIGRVTAPDPVGDHLDEAQRVIGVADAAELTWVFGLQTGAPSVQSARKSFNKDGADVVAANLDQWLASYDQATAQLSTPVEPAVDGVRRLVLASVQVSREAVETLGAAAAAGDAPTRKALLAQVDRLRARAQSFDFEARQLFAALGGELDTGLPAPPSPGPSLPRPSAPPPPSGLPTGLPTGPPTVAPTGDASPTARASEAPAEPTASES